MNPKEISLSNGDVVCWEHGYQRSGDNTCEPCYMDRALKNGPGLIDGMIEAIENIGSMRNWGDE